MFQTQFGVKIATSMFSGKKKIKNCLVPRCKENMYVYYQIISCTENQNLLFFQVTFFQLYKVLFIFVTHNIKNLQKWINSCNLIKTDRQRYRFLVAPFYWIKVK